MSERIDTVARAMADEVPRRRVLRWLGAGAAGAGAALLGLVTGEKVVFASNGRRCAPGKQFPCGGSCCPNGSTCCIVNGQPFCCQPGIIGTTCPLTVDGLLSAGCLGV